MVRPAVLLDATSIPPNRGGVARYIAGLLTGLQEAGAQVGVVVKHDDLDWLRSQAPAHHYTTAPRWTRSRPLRLLWEQVGLPLVVRRSGARVLHSPHYTFPLATAAMTDVTLHDATFFSDPAAHGRLKRTFFRTWIRLARRWAAATIAPSAATAAAIDAVVPRGRTAVAHLGVDRTVFGVPAPSVVHAFAREHDLDPDTGWIAFLGTVEPRKQVPALIAAHARLRGAGTAVPPLLVAGGLGWDERARGLLEEAGDRAGAPVRYLGYLPLEELASFLGGATLVVYPSTGEGFGLPVLEAMASGAAVVTTARLAIPEVAGDAVRYVEPTEDGIAEGIASLLADPRARRALAEAGTARAAAFTWHACAVEHLRMWRA